jgi:hypothetical protein
VDCDNLGSNLFRKVEGGFPRGASLLVFARGGYRFRPEWRLDKTQNFLTQRLALARSGAVNEENAS